MIKGFILISLTITCVEVNHTPYPRLQFLELLLASLHSQVLSLVQTVLQVLDGDLQVLLHPLQVRTGVLFLLQFLGHHSSLESHRCTRSNILYPARDVVVPQGKDYAAAYHNTLAKKITIYKHGTWIKIAH